MNRNEQKVYIDLDIPLEQQIAFLRQAGINFKFNTFTILKEKLGNEGIDIFKTIWQQHVREGIDKIKNKKFEEIKQMAGVQDKIYGFEVKPDYIRQDDFQYIVTYCPYLEESMQRELDMDFCNIMEEVEIEEVSKNVGKLTEYTRMCRGDAKCTIRMRNTLGK